MNRKGHRSGFVTIAGRPNVGKSTLLNRLVGRKVAIVSDKPQTTRHRIQSVLTLPGAQVIFLDTPGIHKPRHQLGEYMVKVALSTLRGVDLILFLVEAHAPFGPGDRFILERLKEAETPVILCINKIDLVPKESLLPLIDELRQKHAFAAIVPFSARTGENTGRLLDEVVAHLPPGPQYYPAGTVTDQPEQLLVAEIIREKIWQLTREELPYGVAVAIEEMVPRSAGLLYVRAAIYVEKESQKGILVGKHGRMLKQIGQLAREEIEALLSRRVYLELWVKVKQDWRQKENFLRQFGYRPD